MKRALLSGMVLVSTVAVVCQVSGCLGRQKSGQWVDRSYSVSFQWNGGFNSIRGIDNSTNKPEADPELRRTAFRESKRAIHDILSRTGLKTAEGQFQLVLHGSGEPYLVTWSDADIPELDQLMHAAATWDLETVRRIISGGMTVDARALDSGNTALILAASDPTKLFTPVRLSQFKQPDKETFQYLLTAGANPNVKGYLGSTALMRANDAFIAQALIRHGATVNAEDSDGWSALVYAIKYRDTAKLQILINAHADVNVRDKNGWTPLMYAADEGDLEATKLLLAFGANPRFRNKQGETALEIAREKSKRMPTRDERKIVELLSAQSR